MKLWARRGFEWAEEGLAGLWCPVLTGATGSTLLDCNPSTSNHGALTNFSNLNSAWVGSQYGTVLDFDGTDDFVDPANVTGVGFGNFTFAAWVRTSVVARRYMIASNIIDVGSEGHWLAFETSNRLYSYFGNELFATASGITLADNNWHLVGVTRSGTTGTLFADGRQIGSSGAIGGFDAGKGNFRIGARGDSLIQNWQGQIAEIAIWNRAATASNFLELFGLGPGGAWQLTPPSRRYATILANAYTLIAASASYSITGQPVGLLAGRLLAADAASYLLAGNAAGLNAGRLLTADSAAYALNGQDANLLASRLLSSDTATYNLIGNSANLLASRTLQADSAQYTVTGSDAALLAGRLLDCGSSAFLLSPNQAGLLASRKLTADQASILLTTQATNLYAGRKITAETAQFILIASPVDLTFGGGGAAPYYYLFLLGGSR